MLLKKEYKINSCPVCDGEVSFSENFVTKNFWTFKCNDCNFEKSYINLPRKSAIKKWNEDSKNWLEYEIKENKNIKSYNKALEEAAYHNYNNFKMIPQNFTFVANGHYLFSLTTNNGNFPDDALVVYFLKKEIIIDEIGWINFLKMLYDKNEALKVFDSEEKDQFLVEGIIKEKLQELLGEALRYDILRKRDITRKKVNEEKEHEKLEKERKKQEALELERRTKEFEKVFENES